MMMISAKKPMIIQARRLDKPDAQWPGQSNWSRPIRGSGGSSGSASSPKEEPDNLQSRQRAYLKDIIGAGPIKGLVRPGYQSFALDYTRVQNLDGTNNFPDMQDPAHPNNPDKRIPSDMQLFFLTGTQDQQPIPGFETEEATAAEGLKLRYNVPYTRTFTNPILDALRFAINTPSLVKTKKNNDIVGAAVRLKFELNIQGAGWVEIINDTIKGKTTSGYTRSYEITLPPETKPGPWQVRITRLTKDSTTVKRRDETSVESYTEVIDQKLSHPLVAYAVSLFDATQFSGIPSRQWEIYGRIVDIPANYDPITRTRATTGPGTTAGVWDGTFKRDYTANNAWVCFDLLKDTENGLGSLVDQARLDASKWWFEDCAKTCDVLVSNGFQSIANPSAAPVITRVGVAGAATYKYKIVAIDSQGSPTAASPEGQTTTGNALLGDANYNTITWAAVTGAVTYRIYRTVVTSGSPATLGVITEVSNLTYNDHGDAGDGSTPPAVSESGMEPRYEFNGVISGTEQALRAVYDFFGTMNAAPAFVGGLIVPVQDKLIDPSQYGDPYGPKNVEGGIFSFSSASRRARHNVALIEWNDMDDFARPKTEYVEDQEALLSKGQNEIQITAMGCTSRGQAHRRGRSMLLQEQRLTQSVQFRTGLQGAANRPGDVIPISVPWRGRVQTTSGRVRGTAAVITGAGTAAVNGTYAPSGKDSQGHWKWVETTGTDGVSKYQILYDVAHGNWAILLHPVSAEGVPATDRKYNSAACNPDVLPWDAGGWVVSATGSPGTAPAPTVAPGATTLDRQVTITAGHTYQLFFTTNAGVNVTEDIATGPSTTDTLTFVAMPSAPLPDAQYIFIDSLVRPELFSIRNIKLLDNLKCEIGGIQYDPDIYDLVENNLVLEPYFPPAAPDPSNQPRIGAITFEHIAGADNTSTINKVAISWIEPQNPDGSRYPFTKEYLVSYRHETNNWLPVGTGSTREPLAELDLDSTGTFEVKIIAVNVLGGFSAPVTDEFFLIDGNPLATPQISGLELQGQGNDTVFIQRDAKFQWRLNSPAIAPAGTLGTNDAAGIGGAQVDPFFKTFEVTIWNGSDQIWSENVTDPQYTFTEEKNQEGMRKIYGANALPLNRFRIEVRVIDSFNQRSAAASLTVSNPPTADPTFPTVSATLNGALAGCTLPPDPDLSYVEVLMSTDPFAADPPVVGRIAIGSSTVSLAGINPNADKTLRYFWVRAVDTFGNRSRTVLAGSCIPGFVPGDITLTPAGGSSTAAITVFAASKTPNAIIYWREDSSTTGITDNVYDPNVGISVSGTGDHFVTAVAYLGGQWGTPNTQKYTINPATLPSPNLSPAPASYPSASGTKLITITAGTGATGLIYTLDGTTPTLANGTTVGTSISLTLPTGHTQVQAVSSAGSTLSSPTIGDYMVINSGGTVATPTITASPGPDVNGIYSSNQTITLACATTGAAMRYTTDGSTPTQTSGALYAGPFNIGASVNKTKDFMINVVAYKTGLTEARASLDIFIDRTS